MITTFIKVLFYLFSVNIVVGTIYDIYLFAKKKTLARHPFLPIITGMLYASFLVSYQEYCNNGWQAPLINAFNILIAALSLNCISNQCILKKENDSLLILPMLLAANLSMLFFYQCDKSLFFSTLTLTAGIVVSIIILRYHKIRHRRE